jgi:hypothetical protein
VFSEFFRKLFNVFISSIQGFISGFILNKKMPEGIKDIIKMIKNHFLLKRTIVIRKTAIEIGKKATNGFENNWTEFSLVRFKKA